jgi:hypothetical protein
MVAKLNQRQNLNRAIMGAWVVQLLVSLYNDPLRIREPTMHHNGVEGKEAAEGALQRRR